MQGEPIGTLLAVDDEEDIRNLTAMYAGSLGFRTFEAEDGQAALDLLKDNQVDVIVSDMKMPRKDGMTLLRDLRDQGDRTPFLFLSAFTTREYTVKAMTLGAFDYLEKPFMPNDFKALLNEMLRVSKAQKGAFKNVLSNLPLAASTSKKVSAEAEILRMASLRVDSDQSIIGLASGSQIDRQARLLKSFAAEAQTQLDYGLRALANLRHAEAPSWQLGYLFRVTNSIKTTAASLQLEHIHDLSESMERAYVLLRIRTSYLSKATLANLTTAHAILRRHLDALKSEPQPSGQELNELLKDTRQIILALDGLTQPMKAAQ